METEESLKKFFPECNDEDYKYHYDSSLPIKNQVIDEKDGMYLLNVRKVYTNGVYFGVNFTQLMTTGIVHGFKCKDRGYSEEDVDNKNWFLENWYNDLDTILPDESYFKEHSFLLQEFKLPYDVYFCFDSKGNYKSSNIVFSDGKVIRGLYGVKRKSDIKKDSKGILTNFFKSVPTEKEIVNYVKAQSTAFSNIQHTVSTAYSSIIIEHSTQYEQEWSDIRRRNRG